VRKTGQRPRFLEKSFIFVISITKTNQILPIRSLIRTEPGSRNDGSLPISAVMSFLGQVKGKEKAL
jgi:hypothetical protein